MHQAVLSWLADVRTPPTSLMRASPAARQRPRTVHMPSVRVQSGELMRPVGARPGVSVPCARRGRCAGQPLTTLY